MNIDVQYSKNDKWEFKECFDRTVDLCWQDNVAVTDKDIIAHMKSAYENGNLIFMDAGNVLRAEMAFENGGIFSRYIKLGE